MIIKTISIPIFPQYKTNNVVFAVQPDLVGKDMRGKTGFLFHRIKMNACFHQLGDKRR